MKRPPWKIVGILFSGAAIMFVTGYLIATRILFPPLPEPENGIVVPRLTGLTIDAAREQLYRLDLRLTETTEVPHASQRPGVIIAQSPLPGQQLRELGEVRVGVSALLPAPEPIPIPVPIDSPGPSPIPSPVPDTAAVQDTVSLSR